MATLIKRGASWEIKRHSLDYGTGDRGTSYSFPCDELGNVEWQQLRLIGRASLKHCETGVYGRPHVRSWWDWQREPDLYYCSAGCGRTIVVHRLDQVEPCDDCFKRLQQEYPQGWRYYPGDVCPHGTYVGGCGIDWMCGACEGGN